MSSWQKEKKNDLTAKVLLFFLFPVLSFLYSFRRANTKSSYLVFFLMSMLFGMAFTVESGKENGGFDGQHYRQLFESYSYTTYLEFNDHFLRYLTFESNEKDFFFDALYFYLSRITDNYHIMFLITAMIFSYFCLRSFRFFSSVPYFNSSITTLILTYLFFYIQLFNINGARFWTAAWIAIYCIFQINVNNNKKYYLLALLLPFMHGSFVIVILVLLVAFLFKKFDKVWAVLLYISIAFSSLATTILVQLTNTFQSYLPVFIIKLTESYTSKESIEGSGFSWVSEAFGILNNIYLNILVLIIILCSKTVKANPKTKNLYLFLLVWTTVFNFLSSVPSMGRFIALSYPMIAYIWLYDLKNTRYQNILLLMPFVFAWNFYTNIKLYNAVLDPLFFFSNPFYIIYKYIIAY